MTNETCKMQGLGTVSTILCLWSSHDATYDDMLIMVSTTLDPSSNLKLSQTRRKDDTYDDEPCAIA